MKTIYTCLLIAIAFLGLTSLSNCTRDNDCPETKEEKINLTQDELSKIPYTGYDTLYFLNKQGDTCIVRGTGKQFYYDTEIGTGDPACPPPISTDYQAYKIQFVPIKGDFDFDFIQAKKMEEIVVYNESTKLNKIVFSKDYNLLRKQDEISKYYLDTLTINKIKYEEVNLSLVREDGFVIVDTTYRLIINRSNGVLLFRNDNANEVFSIISNP